MQDKLILKDIHLPVAISWFPPAIGWWLILASLLLMPVIYYGYQYLYRKITQPTVMKSAKNILATIKNNQQINNQEKLQQISQLLRRVAMSQNSRLKIASLFGVVWLKYLDQNLPDQPFTTGAGKILLDGHYQLNKSLTELEIMRLIELCEIWLDNNV